eukprot:CAMPEP_0201491986 /NCGR_PEP_ID=MMETSP0151_2-20130828/32005_1 /ASSEMBLY_ACC=CAM_ASM_000257 /TAXON_ID=200890 /ORGANISM="Paramoeba atlantica, Strain 621/1 / CCAP 1560/9" /LENGTH=280 /DNA_ID=CAMNT_0047878625 /DNA_START=74 /DNA_END=917 /DNA_ORIENTATION=+
MASRNRTKRFLELREECKLNAPRSPETHSGDHLLQSGEVSVSMEASPPPKWMPLVDEIKLEIMNIEKQMQKLEGLHSDHLLVGFGDEYEQEQQIQILTSEITHRFQQNNRKLKKLTTKEMGAPVSSKDEQMKKNVRATLANQLQQLSFDFRRKQREYLKKVEGRHDDQSDLFYVEQKNKVPEEYMDKGFTDAQMDIVVIQEDERRRKSQEIQEIVKSIQDLAEIMEDLRVLVLDQGTILDRIDFNLEQVEELTKISLGEVEEAMRHKDLLVQKHAFLGFV